MTNTEPMADVVVTQADRNAAVRLLEAGGQDWHAKEIRLGHGDHFPTTQAFARHRIEASHPAPSEASGGKYALSPEWCINMAKQEGDAEIGAGMPDHPLRAPSGVSGDVVEAVAKAISKRTYATINTGPATDCNEWEDMSEMDRDTYRRAAADALSATPAPQADAWRPIETAPLNDQFIAALEVRNNKTGQSWWEKHLIWIDDETGDVHSDCEQGWGLRDYIYWHPVPASPLTERPTDAD